METITSRDLRQHLAETLDGIQAGITYTITRDGQPAAVLVPPMLWQAIEDAEDELAAREAMAVKNRNEETFDMATIIADMFERS